jgi:Ca2+-binding RTX toxin-like protein
MPPTRGSGGRGSGNIPDNYGLDYEFDLFTLKADGTPTTFIGTGAGSISTGAIENFKGSFQGDEFFTTNDPRFDFFIDNPSRTISFPSQTTDLGATPSRDGFKYQFSPVTYQYTDGSNNLQSGSVVIDFFLTDDDPYQDGFQVNVKDQNGAVTINTIDPGRATNDVEYTVSKGLFGSVDSVSIDGKDGNGNPFSVELQSNGRTTFTPINPTDNPPTNPVLNGDDVLTGDNGDNTLLGGEGNNVLRGQDGNDVLETGSGSDNLDGGNGNDALRSGGGNDILTGGAGADNIDGGEGNDTIDGGSEDDLLLGGAGDDLINGGNGNDILNGGAGQDVLVGDGGADIFALNTLGGADVIRDFNYGEDRIGLSDGITFDDLTITQGNGAAIISYQGQDIGSVSGATPSQLGASFFTAI